MVILLSYFENILRNRSKKPELFLFAFGYSEPCSSDTERPSDLTSVKSWSIKNNPSRNMPKLRLFISARAVWQVLGDGYGEKRIILKARFDITPKLFVIRFCGTGSFPVEQDFLPRPELNLNLFGIRIFQS